MSEQRREQLAVIAGLVLILVLALPAVCLAGPLVLPWRPLPFGYEVSLCVVWQTAPRFQAGVYWASPYFSYVPPGLPPAVSCSLVPWLPLLPQRGAVLVP